MYNSPSIFCHHTLHIALDDDEILAIAIEVQRLCTNVPKIFNDFQEEISRLEHFADHYIKFAEKKDCTQAKPLTAVYEKISKKSLTIKLFIGAFIATDCSYQQDNVVFTGDSLEYNMRELSSQESYDLLTNFKRLLLFSAYRLIYSNYPLSKALIMTNEFRQLVLGKRFDDGEQIFSLPLVTDFKNLTQLSHFVFNKSRKHLNKIGGGVYWSSKEKPQYPKSEGYSFNTEKSYQKENVGHLPVANRLTFHSEKSTMNFWHNRGNNNKDITEKESKKQIWIERYAQTDNIPSDQQALASKEKHKVMSSRQRRLPCDGSNALNDNIATFLSHSGNWRGNEATAVEMLLWSLYLGKPLPNLATAINSGDAFIRYNHDKRCHEACYQLDLPQTLFRSSSALKHQTIYYFQLPKQFSRIFHTFSDIEKYLPIAKKCLKQFNKQHQTHLTIGNIGSYLKNYLLNTGKNKHLIQLLTEPMLNHQTPLYYTCIERDQLFEIQSQYLEHLQSYTDFLEAVPKPKENFLIASKIIISEENVRAVFASLAEDIKRYIDKHHRHDEVLHNAFTLYLYLLLTFCNGYRPVSQTLGYVSDYDLASGLCFLSDKERSEKVEGRINYLGETACRQLNLYLQYCRFQYFYYQQKNRPLANQYKQVLNSEKGLLFFLQDGFIVPFTPKNIEAQFEANKIKLPLNWARHYVLTLLLQLKTADSCMNAWSGHDDDGQIPFSRFSSIATEDLKAVAKELDYHLVNNLNVSPIEVYSEKRS